MSPLRKLGKKGSRILGIGFALAWTAVFAFLVWPALRGSKDDEVRIEDMSRRIELLGGWNEGRRALGIDAESWAEKLNERFDRMFPRQRGLQKLFYEIAAAANRSDVDPVKISVKNPGFGEDWRDDSPDRAVDDMDDDMDDDMGEGGIESLYASLDISPDEFPGNELQSHRLAVEVDAGYDNVARFLDEVSRLDRAVTVSNLDMKTGDRGVVALIELEYYVQATN